MALTIASAGFTSTLLPGFGFEAAVSIAWDNSYPTGGETADLSAIFANEVYGGFNIADTQDDAGYIFSYVRGTGGAPATGVIQLYWGDYNNGADGPAVQVADMTDVSAIDGQIWMFFGR